MKLEEDNWTLPIKLFSRVPNSTFEARDYTYASEDFVETLTGALTINVDWFNPSPVQSQLFTSDYALYWYDYLSGYGTVFAEFVGDQSRQIAVALDRGAANVLGKDWGAIITYQENGPENATQLYSDMKFAWQSGAKYIVVFDGNSTDASTSGVLTQAHIRCHEAVLELHQNQHTWHRISSGYGICASRRLRFWVTQCKRHDLGSLDSR